MDWIEEKGETVKYTWKKTLNGTEKNIAILEISDKFINSLISTYGGKSPVVWVFIALALHSRYPGIFPPIWDDWGNLNAFWGSNDLEQWYEHEPGDYVLDFPLPTFLI